MARGSARDALRHLTTLCRSGVLGNLNDEELLERFIELSDDSAEEAFATLVRRHGPMVLGVCNRILRDSHEAEDAFQATFLVLARKATAVVPREKVANWLYGVAYRTAMESRNLAARRRAREEKVSMRLRVQATDVTFHDELRAILDEELSCLPARYRGPIVLCELEGLSRQEAAGRLGVPEGTLSSRLARAKVRLRDRLTRRGLAIPAGTISLGAIRDVSATALLSDALIESTTLAAMRVAAGTSATAVISTSVVSLTEGVLKTMLLTKLKGIALAIGSSIAVISGAVALGQSPGTGLGSTTQSDTERMTVMERKLDRIIDALDRLSGATSSQPDVRGAAYPDRYKSNTNSDYYGKADVKSAPKVSYPNPAQNNSSGQFPGWLDQNALDRPAEAKSPMLSDRVAAVERSLQDVHNQMKLLASRVSKLEGARRGTQRTDEEAKKP
jgi:RNA polymerase sigma factor (sigma-70 family)